MKAATVSTAAEARSVTSLREAEANRGILDFAELIKARLTLLVLVTTAVGFYLGTVGPLDVLSLMHAVFGTAMAAAGAAALNQWWERRLDALMHRTKGRPIPAGRMSPRSALIFGAALSAAGVLYLALICNRLSAALAALTIVIYIFGYTPLKRISTANTLVGAIPGALPPMIGWAAARGAVEWPAWSLFVILFCWQMPHFYAIAWMYRDDYARAGFRMLSNHDAHGLRSGRQSVVFAGLLVLVSTWPALFGIASSAYVPLELLVGLGFFAFAVHFWWKREMAPARRLFLASIIFLPLLLLLLVLTKT